ncbi:MAG: hypothetical protein KIT09_24410 [Bryobacteraceae bacterium]|nr:hypothetical protein [Bryobacteraceae bacterium]
MRAQLAVLREVFEEWLCIHEIDYDYRFYTPDEWEQHEGPENLLKGAELVLTFENDLFLWMNYGTSVPDELQDLAEGFGYYFELGHAWNMGFYPIEDWPALPSPTVSYSERLKDPRWQKKRSRIPQRCNSQCEECASTQCIEVHHCYYRYGREPWQYPDIALLALCRSCHKDRADAEMRFRLFQQSLSTEELRGIQAMFAHCKYWYDGQTLRELLSALRNAPGTVPRGGGPGAEPLSKEQHDELTLNAKYGAISQKLLAMLKTSGHPEDRGELRSRGRL